MTNILWKCEQWFGGQLHERNVFDSEQQAKDFVRKLSAHAPDIVCRIEPMPLEHVWN